MKIMSLNVNQFQVLKLQEGSWAKEILAFIKKFLYDNPDGAVFLYEIPKRFWKTGDLEAALVPYEVIYSGAGIIHTVVIKCKNSIWIPPTQNRFACENKDDYKNRYIELYHQKSGIRALGIHAPGNDPKETFLEAVSDYAKAVENLIIVGDFNITTNESRTKIIKDKTEKTQQEFFERQKWLLKTMPDIGYFDAVKDDQVTFFPAKTTIDHVLVSESLKKNVRSVNVKVFSQEELELSDHAVIIVDIQEKTA